MELGNKILELRKKERLSQEELAEKLNVTRQTISNWELGQTSPDINQAKELSKVFKVSLDELVGNDVKNILVEKVNNTEELAGNSLRILKFLGIGMIMIIVGIVLFGLFGIHIYNNQPGELMALQTIQLKGTLDDQEYTYTINYDDQNNIFSAGGDGYIADAVNTEEYSNAKQLITVIKAYFENNGGTCEEIKK